MATRKKHQLDINLSNVKDQGVREALNSIVSHVNSLSQEISVSSGVKARDFSTHTGLFKAEADGKINCSSIRTDSNEAIKFKIFTGNIATISGTTLSLSGNHKVVGTCGHTTMSGSTTTYKVMGTEVIGDGCFFTNTTNSTNKVRIFNSDSSTNSYRVIIFYVEN